MTGLGLQTQTFTDLNKEEHEGGQWMRTDVAQAIKVEALIASRWVPETMGATREIMGLVQPARFRKSREGSRSSHEPHTTTVRL